MLECAKDEKAIFLAALERATPGERQAYLQGACGSDPALLKRLKHLLSVHEQSHGPLDAPSPLLALAPTADDPVTERSGTVIGPYKLMEQIGAGGMGLVFVAEQQHPIRRKVALKVIKPGMDTRQVIARFEAERQALALMDHPNIAKVHDGGETTSGRPYFVMELVKGVPITEYCDQNQTPIRQRLELFLNVCLAVQHAHQKGIIHRDLKPSNVLVVSNDGTPLVKVIDFGVAKAIGQQLTDKTLYTHFTQLLGTPLYMSPEQAGQSGVDVDTRTDIYALGVLLYELLTGTTPFEKERLNRASDEEIRRIIREEEPPKPSTRISALGQAATTISTERKSEPKRLSQLLRGELDWIVMKALEKERSRRYETASAFAADVQRYLLDEPVQACPPSALYRFEKFARRYKAALSTAALVLATVITGLIISTIVIAGERDKARSAADDAQEQSVLASTQAAEAQKERERAEANLLKAKEAVDRLFTQVAEKLADKPQMEQIRRKLLEDALEFYHDFLKQKPRDPVMQHETARAHMRVGDILQALGQPQRGEESEHRAIALLEKLVVQFPRKPEYREDLAGCYDTLSYIFNIAEKEAESVEAARQVLAQYQQLATDFPTVSRYRHRLAASQTTLGWCDNDLNRKEGEKYCRQALASWDRIAVDFPGEPVDRYALSYAHQYLGFILLGTYQYQEAESHLLQALRLREQIPEAVDSLAHIRAYVGELYYETGRSAEAERYYRLSLNTRLRQVSDFPGRVTESHRRLVYEYRRLGQALLALGRPQEGEDALRRAVTKGRQVVSDHPGIAPFPRLLADASYHLGLLLEATGRSEEAAKLFREAISAYEQNVAESPNSPNAKAALAWALTACPAPQFQDPSRAVGLAKQALQRSPLKPDLWRAWGLAEYRSGHWQAAIDAFSKAAELDHSPGDWHFFFWAMAYWQLGDKDRATKLYEQARKWMDVYRPGDLQRKYFRDEADGCWGARKQRK